VATEKGVVNREFLVLGVVLVTSYGLFLGFTARNRDAVAVQSVADQTPTLQAEPRDMESIETPAPTQQPPEVAHDAELASPAVAEELGETDIDNTPPIQTATSPKTDALLQLVYSSDPRAIQTLSQAIRPGNDRETRLAAVNALLLMGRKSTVDPAVTAALRIAAKDADSGVSSEATSALAEVEREMH
jgi:hypothetical protein